ncbi:predicted protein [Ostreococcus lucimarinus CCE9901]|jgi:hypothetical protein|uniref:HSA domain-containing protein n=1 Tax=Ostreococcus lucimarinus (strain CCE9901) TaxID=436017 RepID=A4S9M8_OSTLU|nr:predicted protein [Ostreococcus lucimarinus CCE9901]ABP00515.1 predicted protein [Ostreococcus lucimarinus CCE9901]|tara:strand:+ start:733 stop:3006 length:2274 start_codon:yes stop_codon:yes gene_type:complete|eukprot:XP_001422198.1 predicted protein [Ostreococcus lucimarinus CCE9901]
MARDRGGASTSAVDETADETGEARRRRLRDEDMLVARAKAIREKIKALDARANVKTHDDSRRKSHWEYVMMEMTWLARDFASERDWKQETSRQVSHLAASCEGAPKDREEQEVTRRKTRCAMIAADVAEFWAEAWERAKERPLPNAGELVEDEDEGSENGSADGEEIKMETESDEDDGGEEGDAGEKLGRQATLTPTGDAELSPTATLASTPPPPAGMRIINSWASNKLYLAMVEMKRDLVKDAIELKEAKEQKEREKEAKKAAKKSKGAPKATPKRGRGSKKKDDEDEDEDEDADGDAKADRIALAEALEIDGMDLDMDLLAPPTPPLVEEFMPVIYDAVPMLNERAFRETMQIEAQKFAEYERSLRGWEENERKRARALVEAARYQAEEEAHRETMEQRRAFLAAAAARGHYFDEEGYMVDIKGRRRKNKRGEYIQFGVPGHEVDMDFGVPIPKRTGPMDDRRRKDAKKKRRAGAMRSWSPMEDQLLCAIVHEFGSNWALITDAFAASTPIKGTYHRIDHCRWRFSHLTQVAEQQQDQRAIAALDLNKGSARTLMARALPVEDETVRIHFDRSCAVMAKHLKIRKAAKMERLGMNKSRRNAPHRSWREVQSICGPTQQPLSLADDSPVGGVTGNGSVMPGGQRLGTMLPMGGVASGRSGVPSSAAGGLARTPSGGIPGSSMPGKKDAKSMAQFQQIGSYSPASGGAAMQLGGIGGAMPVTGSKSPALAPGSYNLSGSKTPPAKKTTQMKRKGKRK